ncbi:MAG TPA: serine/threonine-protein kinase [Humisphaera sp.]
MSTHQGETGAALPKNLFGYEVLDYIGQGAGSRIYVVSDPKTRQLYALKHVTCKTDKDHRFIEQLEAEFEVGRKVADPGLRKVLEFKSNKSFLRKASEACLLMELFDGQPLETHRPESIRRVVDIFIKVSKAIEGLHKAGFVHCDLKPNNIMLGGTGVVKVIDLGQTCPIGTVKERIQGTPDYISPEQVHCLAVSPKTDVYNFGATLYWALTGTNMPTLFTLKKGENSLMSDDLLKTPAQINPRVPEPLSNLVMECVRIKAEKRPEQADVTRRLEIMLFGLERAAMQKQQAVQQAAQAQRVMPPPAASATRYAAV